MTSIHEIDTSACTYSQVGNHRFITNRWAKDVSTDSTMNLVQYLIGKNNPVLF